VGIEQGGRGKLRLFNVKEQRKGWKKTSRKKGGEGGGGSSTGGTAGVEAEERNRGRGKEAADWVCLRRGEGGEKKV